MLEAALIACLLACFVFGFLLHHQAKATSRPLLFRGRDRWVLGYLQTSVLVLRSETRTDSDENSGTAHAKQHAPSPPCTKHQRKPADGKPNLESLLASAIDTALSLGE